MPSDTYKDYYNLTHPNKWAIPGAFFHRLGQFQAMGIGARKNKPYPSIVILHVPVADYYKGSGIDPTAERVADYLANPGEQRTASVHVCSDRDSFVLCQPFDSVCWGCANPNTAQESIEIEIAGDVKTESYWRSSDAILKYRQAAKAIKKGLQLSFGSDWKKYCPPLQKGALNFDGSLKTPGFLQHRDVPYWDEIIITENKKRIKTGKARVLKSPGWAQPPVDNIKAGQHSDINKDFPWDLFFKIAKEELSSKSIDDFPKPENKDSKINKKNISIGVASFIALGTISYFGFKTYGKEK